MDSTKKRQRFIINLSHRSIIIWLSLAAFIHNIVMNGAMNVIISSLQKEFYLSSQDTGVYISVYDIGSLMSSLVVPMLGSHGSKPRWISFGMCMLCIGCFINVLPHFLRPKNDMHTFHNITSNSNTHDEITRIELCTNYANYTTDADFDDCLAQKNSLKTSNSAFRFNNLKYLLYASNIVNGLSSASMTTLAFSYIEDIAPPNLSAIYESVYYATGALGMGVGFMITSQFLNIHNDIDSMKVVPKWMTPSHPNWIGAWWLPFIIFGTIAFMLAMFILTFPRRIVYKKDETNASNTNGVHVNDEHLNTESLSLHSNKENENCSRVNSDNEDEHEKLNDVPEQDEVYNQTTTNSNGTVANHNHNHHHHSNHHHSHHHENTFLGAVKEAGSTLSLNRSAAGVAAATVIMGSSQFITSNGETKQSTKNLNNIVNKKLKTHEKFIHTIKLAINLLKNPIFVCILIAAAIEGLLQNSFLAFASLFIEYQYRIASGTASFVLGALSIPPLILGSLLSGFLIKKFQWKMKSCLSFLTIMLFFNLILYSGFLVNCKEPNILLSTDQPTLNGHQKTTISTSDNIDDYEIQQQKLMTTNSVYRQRNLIDRIKHNCFQQTDSQCICNENTYKPICLTSQNIEFVFQSPCIAGCQTYNQEASTYSNCTYAECILNSKKYIQQQRRDLKLEDELFYDGDDSSLFASFNYSHLSTLPLVNGLCPAPKKCFSRMIISYLTIFLVMFSSAMIYIPYIKVTIGCVPTPEMNTIALGIKQLAMTGIGTIPGPIIFGSCIDLTCRYWYTDCLNQKVCKIYNNRNFSLAFGVLGIGFKTICWLAITSAFLIMRANQAKKRQQQQQKCSSSKNNETASNA